MRMCGKFTHTQSPTHDDDDVVMHTCILYTNSSGLKCSHAGTSEVLQLAPTQSPLDCTSSVHKVMSICVRNEPEILNFHHSVALVVIDSHTTLAEIVQLGREATDYVIDVEVLLLLLA